MKNIRFAIKTLGCKVNQYESQVLRENLLRYGYVEALPEEADMLILNSCTVTHQADVKTRRMIKRIKKDNPGIKVYVTGCYAVFDDDVAEIESLEEVFKVIRNKDKMAIPEILDHCFGSEHKETALREEVSGFSAHTRSFLKIQDGCDQSCSYCKVNLVRGPSVSRDEKEILGEIRRLLDAGFKEIVLTGICLGSWNGHDNDDLASLLEQIISMNGEFRIRLSSIEPNHIDEHLSEVIASSDKICKHLHIPLQSGSDKILSLMKRRYNKSQFYDKVEGLRQKIPLIGITMDVILGFPGETEQDFTETCQFIKKIRPSRLHVFKYSDRKGTESFNMPGKVSGSVAKERVSHLIGIGDELQAEFCDRFIGREVSVLIEEVSNNVFMGYTSEYVRTEIFNVKASKGEIVNVVPVNVKREGPCLIA